MQALQRDWKDCIRDMSVWADDVGLEEIGRELRALLADAAHHPVRLAVVGLSGRALGAHVNRLIGRQVLPAELLHWEPWVPVRVREGSETEVIVRFANGSLYSHWIADAAEWLEPGRGTVSVDVKAPDSPCIGAEWWFAALPQAMPTAAVAPPLIRDADLVIVLRASPESLAAPEESVRRWASDRLVHLDPEEEADWRERGNLPQAVAQACQRTAVRRWRGEMAVSVERSYRSAMSILAMAQAAPTATDVAVRVSAVRESHRVWREAFQASLDARADAFGQAESGWWREVGRRLGVVACSLAPCDAAEGESWRAELVALLDQMVRQHERRQLDDLTAWVERVHTDLFHHARQYAGHLADAYGRADRIGMQTDIQAALHEVVTPESVDLSTLTARRWDLSLPRVGSCWPPWVQRLLMRLRIGRLASREGRFGRASLTASIDRAGKRWGDKGEACLADWAEARSVEWDQGNLLRERLAGHPHPRQRLDSWTATARQIWSEWVRLSEVEAARDE